MNSGDIVLFVPLLPLPTPRGKQRMYTIGVVTTVYDSLVSVVDTCGISHCVYSRGVRLITPTVQPTTD